MGISQDNTDHGGSDGHGDGLRTDGGEPGEGPPTLDEKDSPSVTEIYDRWTEHEDAATESDEEAEIEALREAMDAAGVDVPDELDDSPPADEAAANEKSATASEDGVGQWTTESASEGETVAAESEAAAGEGETAADAAATGRATEGEQSEGDADEPTDAAPAATEENPEADEADAEAAGTVESVDAATVEPSAETIRDGDAGTVERVVDPEVGRVVYTYGHAGGASVTTVPISETRVGDEE